MTSTPPRPVIIPLDLILGHFAERAGLNEIVHSDLIRLAAMLGSDLNDQIPGQHRIAQLLVLLGRLFGTGGRR